MALRRDTALRLGAPLLLIKLEACLLRTDKLVRVNKLVMYILKNVEFQYKFDDFDPKVSSI